jgi:hypothetical protein
MAKKKPFTPAANAAGVKSETIKAAADVVVNDAENVSNTVSTESTEKNDTTQEGSEDDSEKGANTVSTESTEKNDTTQEGSEDEAEKGTTTITSESVVNETFEFNGKNYKLAPFVNKLQVNGRVYQREEILTNKEIMASLIIGNSPFIKKA